VIYRGWDAVCLSNQLVSLNIVPAIGGRVMQYAIGDKEFLWVNPTLAGKAPPPGGVEPEKAWLNYGGDKLWPPPQGWDNDEQWPGPPDAVLDGGPYQIEFLAKAGAAVRLTSGDGSRSGILFSRVIRLVFVNTEGQESGELATVAVGTGRVRPRSKLPRLSR